MYIVMKMQKQKMDYEYMEWKKFLTYFISQLQKNW